VPSAPSGVGARPLNFTVRESNAPVRTASILFVLLAALVVLVNAVAWINGAPLRINALQVGVVATHIALAVLLWRQVRPAAFIGVVIALAGLLLLTGAIYSMWPLIVGELATSRGAVEFVGTLITPTALNLAIVVVLVRALLSNNRWRVP
jgi:hypothetical protein